MGGHRGTGGVAKFPQSYSFTSQLRLSSLIAMASLSVPGEPGVPSQASLARCARCTR